MIDLSVLTIWVGAFVTIAVLSYMFRDNPVYRMVQQAALGAAIGIMLMILWNQVLYPRWLLRMWHGFQALGTSDGMYEGEHWTSLFWILAIVPGSLWYFQLSRKYFWVSTIISGFFVGVAAGLAFKTQILLVMPQISASILPLNPFDVPAGETASGWALECLNNFVLLVLMFAALFYFFFSVRTEHPVLAGGVRFGRVAIMICLGALFGNTVMTRVAYLIERLLFLHGQWFNEQVLTLFTG